MIVLAVLPALVLSVARDQRAFDFDGTLPQHTTYHATVARVSLPGGAGHALALTATSADWPGVIFRATPPWDWSASLGLSVRVTNPGKKPLRVFVRADNEGAQPDTWTKCNIAYDTVPPGATVEIRLGFKTATPGPLWGMRGYPDAPGLPPPPARGSAIDPAAITALAVSMENAPPPSCVLIERIRPGPGKTAKLHPFVDRFGQYALAGWPGKIGSEEALQAEARHEAETLRRGPTLPERDEYGGWADGPRLEATGWFRTLKRDGRWWLVTPNGTLFFSLGVDCVNLDHGTFITRRERYFEWLPERDGSFAACFIDHHRPHSHAEPLGEAGGATFDFYGANLIRKDGPNWRGAWTERTYKRLPSWGFNTIGNWSDRDILGHSPLPFVASVWIPDRHRRVEGSHGYWSKIHDPFDEAFARDVTRGMQGVAREFARNPLCIGYFVDNELAWGGDGSFDVARAVLDSPPDQPARQAFVAWLRERYEDPGALAAAWSSEDRPWNLVRVPARPDAACRADLEALTRLFARRYFETVASIVHRLAPQQLYLGCRFAWANRTVIAACAEAADVVSFNIYAPRLDPERWAFTESLGKPCLVGEFHAGATDRGCLHPGLVVARDQTERAAIYKAYVRSVARHPAFVGCHWFQYVDEPVTGRWFDGENYNLGLVTVTDSPYPELVGAAREVHAEVYELHRGQ